jgi:hypothetical protein
MYLYINSIISKLLRTETYQLRLIFNSYYYYYYSYQFMFINVWAKQPHGQFQKQHSTDT